MTDLVTDDLIRRLRIPERGDFTIGDEAADEIEKLNELVKTMTARIEYLRNDIHSCGPTCSRAGCVNGRLRAALEYVLEDENTGIPRASSACRRVVRTALESTK